MFPNTGIPIAIGRNERIVWLTFQEISEGMEIENSVEQESNTHMERGRINEKIAILKYEDLINFTVHSTGFYTHKNYDFVGASPDGIIFSLETGKISICLEVKCPFYKLHDAIPLDYLCQIQGQLEILNTEICHFVSFNSEIGLKVFEVRRNNFFWKWMLPLLHEFYHVNLQKDIEPMSLNKFKSKENFWTPPPKCQIKLIHSVVY